MNPVRNLRNRPPLVRGIQVLAVVVGLVAIGTVASPMRAVAASPISLFGSAAKPAVVDEADSSPVELGVKFKSDVAGTVAGVRFYKGPSNTGIHVGNLWTSTGALLATATFTSESASGWQHVNFASPVAIAAGATYVASYHTNTGEYADDLGGLSSQVNAAPLHTLADGAGGPNGVYAYGASSTFPASGWKGSNYWVDLAFTPATATDTTPPAVAITAPANGAAVSGTVTVSGTASDNVGVTRVMVSVDGGTSLSTTGTNNWTITLTGAPLSSGNHTIAATAFDAAGNMSTSSVAVTEASQSSGVVVVDKEVSFHQSNQSSAISAPSLSTSQGNEVLLSFLSSDGPNSPNGLSFGSVTGGGLTWSLRQRTNVQAGTAEIWQAVAPSAVSNVIVTANRVGGSRQGSIVVIALTGADTGRNGVVAGANGPSGQPGVSLTTTRNGSWVWAVGTDYSNAIARTLGGGQTLVDQYLAPVNDTFWVQRETSTTPASGTRVTINDTAPTADRFNLSAIEVLPATATGTDTTPPTTPTNLHATASGATTVTLSWTPSTDNVAVSGYTIYRGSTKIGTSATTTFSDPGLTASTTYSYTISAYDAAGNTSAQTAPATVTTPSAAGSCANASNPWTSLEACGWAGPANTGFDLTQCPGGVLTSVGSSPTSVTNVTQDNAVISCERITGGLDIQASNVTVKNSYIAHSSGQTGQNANGTAVIKIEDGASATVDHVEINGLNGVHACVWHQGTSASINAINCYGIDDGVFSWADTSFSPTTGDNFTLKNSYFHDFTTLTSNGHEDGYQTEGASNGLIQHNTFMLTTDADSDVAIWDSLKSSSNITVDNNLMTGGGFSVYSEDYNPSESTNSSPTAPVGGFTVTNITYTNNKFSTHAASCVGGYGVWFYRAGWAPYFGGPTDGWHRSGNVVLETGENVDNGNPHSNGNLCQ